MSKLLSIPTEFKLTEAFRMFKHRLMMLDYNERDAFCFALSFWFDWAMAGVEFRQLHGKPLDVNNCDWDSYDWEGEDLTHIIESYCQWNGEIGGLLRVAIASGYVQVQQRNGVWGLVLKNFWAFNEHLSPEYKSIQQRGGLAKAEAMRKRKIEEEAEEQRKLFELQGILPFDEDSKPTKEEERLVYALVMRMDRACGERVRLGSSYSKELMDLALRVIRTYSADDISLVEVYLIEHREDVRVVKITDRILQNFSEYLEKAKQ